MSTLISLRLETELVERCDSEAAARSRPGAKVSRTTVIEDVLREHFGQPATATPPADLLTESVQLPYKCPGVGCNMRTRSKAAICPTHGRKVVPVG